VCVCVYVRMCVCIYIYTYYSIYMYIYAHTYIHIYVCMYVYTYVHTYTMQHNSANATEIPQDYMSGSISHTHIYTYTHTHINTHTHTHTHMYIHTCRTTAQTPLTYCKGTCRGMFYLWHITHAYLDVATSRTVQSAGSDIMRRFFLYINACVHRYFHVIFSKAHSL
jgi:hypothetical protein